MSPVPLWISASAPLTHAPSNNVALVLPPETWNCIQALILAHVGMIQIYCIEKKQSLNPRVVNTDVVEWFFGDARSMVGGATNRLGVRGFDAADRKSSAFNRGRHGVVGNNKSGKDAIFQRNRDRI